MVLSNGELKILNYKQAIQSEDKEEWEKEIEKEYERIEKFKVWKPIPIEDASEDIEALISA